MIMSTSNLIRALLLSAAALLASCGFTPVPEPPPGGSLDLNDVHMTIDLDSGLPYETTFHGSPDASIAGAILWALNFDSTEPPQQETVGEDGSFELTIEAEDGDEVRLQVRLEGFRFDPVDVIVHHDRQPERVGRQGCFSVDPYYEIDFGDNAVPAEVTRTIQVHNGCGGTLTVDSIAERVDLPSLTIETAAPLTIPDGEQRTIDVRFALDAPGQAEDALLIGVTGATEGRWPLTWLGAAE